MKTKNFIKLLDMSDGDKINIISLEQDSFGHYTMKFRIIKEEWRR